MLSKIIRSRHLWIIGMAGIVMFLLFLSATGCGGSDTGAETQTTATVTKRAAPRPVVTRPSVPSVAEESEVMIAEAPREVTYEEAETAYYERRYEAATEMFTQYCERKRENPWGHYMLGLSAWKAGDHATAEQALERALELDPKHTKSWINLSRVLLHDDRSDEAINYIDEAIALDPQSNDAYRLRGRALHQLNRKAEAVQAYRRAIEIDNEDVWAMNNLGLAFIEVGQFEQALPPLARAVEIESGVPLFYNNLGMVLERMGHYRAAEDAYQTAVDLDETYYNAASNLVRIVDVLEDPAIEPIDLAEVAERFVERIEAWRTASLHSAQVDCEPDEIMVSEPDSITNQEAEVFVRNTGITESDDEKE